MPVIHQLVASLRRRDWVAVAIEIFIVVVGVFIGVQASNWNAERETNRRADEFSNRLRSDLREEAWGYELQIGYYGEVLANARRAADALSGRAPLSDEALLVSAYRATQYNGNIRRRSTYDELTSTGEIGLIRNRELLELATRTYNLDLLDDIVRTAQDSQYRMAFRKAIPHEVQRALGDTCGDRIVAVGDFEAIPNALDYACETGLSPDVLAQSVAILHSGSDFQPLLRLRIADIQTDLGNLTEYYRQDVREPLRALAGRKP